MFGSRRFVTRDDSRNNLLVAILTLGEGWHNNHHRYQSSARQGFVWWEIDVSYMALLLLERLGLVWQLRPVPQHVMDEMEALCYRIGIVFEMCGKPESPLQTLWGYQSVDV